MAEGKDLPVHKVDRKRVKLICVQLSVQGQVKMEVDACSVCSVHSFKEDPKSHRLVSAYNLGEGMERPFPVHKQTWRRVMTERIFF